MCIEEFIYGVLPKLPKPEIVKIYWWHDSWWSYESTSASNYGDWVAKRESLYEGEIFERFTEAVNFAIG